MDDACLSRGLPGRRVALLLVLALFSACQARAPRAAVAVDGGIVRGATELQAARMGAALMDVKPRVAALLPDVRDIEVDVWIQEQLAYWSWRPADAAIQGFNVLDTGRIHIRQADHRDMTSTLAHELVHALLGPSWSVLPPVLEEGLADVVATLAVPQAAARVRAGRLADAAGVTGGLAMRVRLRSSRRTWWPTRIVLPDLDDTGADEVLTEVFAESVADLDALHHGSPRRPGLYGCGYLMVARIVERSGFEGLHALCLWAAESGHDVVPAEWLIAAAELDFSKRDWRLAAADMLDDEDIVELARRHAAELGVALAELGRWRSRRPEDFLRRFQPSWGPTWGAARAALADLPEVRAALAEAWDG